MATGVVPVGGGVHPPQDRAVAEASGDNPINVAERVDPKGCGVGDPGTYPQG